MQMRLVQALSCLEYEIDVWNVFVSVGARCENDIGPEFTEIEGDRLH